MLIMLFVGCSDLKPDLPESITLMTHDSFSISKKVVYDFEKANNIQISFLRAGSAGVALNKAILSKNNPMADVFFGVDNTFFTRALKADIFEPYNSPLLSDIHEWLRLDPENRLLPVDYGDICLNYDKKWFEDKKIKPPASLSDITKTEYKSLVVVENPATSSPGLAFLLATIGHFGENGYLKFWEKLRSNDVLVTHGWKDAYWGHFSAASKGNRPIVVSYASSPAAEVHFAEKKMEYAPTASVTEDKSAFRHIEFVGILRGTKNMKLAQKLIDYMLDKKFQEDIPLQMFVFPANRNAQLPEVLKKHASIAKHTAIVSTDAVSANREKWIQAWTRVVLK